MNNTHKSLEQELDDVIDSLNTGKNPGRDTSISAEVKELLPALSAVRHLAEAPLPSPELAVGVRRNLRAQSETGNSGQGREPAHAAKRRSVFSPVFRKLTALAAAAAIVAVVGLSLVPHLFGRDVVLAMGQAVEKVESYHGIMEVKARNAAGDEWMVRRLEIRSYGDKYSVKQEDGTVTTNNLERKWQVRPAEAVVTILPAAPDAMMRGVDLKDEAKRALEYPHTVVAEEIIAGKIADKVEISPPGGLPYYLWLDKETNLPVQLMTAMTNALQTVYTFTTMDINGTVDPSVYEYEAPEGYSVVEEDPGVAVVTVEEAKAVSGVDVLVTKETPHMMLAFSDRVVLVYQGGEVIQKQASGEFEVMSYASMGSASGGPVEVLPDSYRWCQEGLEVKVQGPRRLELAVQIAPDFQLPSSEADLVSRAQVKVTVDLEIAKRDQEQVDGGHSPWQVDPSMVATQFVNVKAPDERHGELTVTENTGVQAVVEAKSGSIGAVYLQKLVRQDESGIWSVVGYDPR